jgi:hypothetical protein
MTYRSSLKVIAINLFLKELCPLNFSELFSTMCAAYIDDLQIKFEDGSYQPIFSVEHLIEPILANVYHHFDNKSPF